MKYIPRLLAYLLFLFAAISNGGVIFWPVGPAGTQNSTRTLFHSFGNYHVGWDTLTAPGQCCNFHMGIDVLPYNNNREVRACSDGYISHIYSIPCDSDSQYVAVIVEDLASSNFGWSYQHIHNPANYSWSEFQPIFANDLLSEMDTLPTTNHMHLSWSSFFYNSNIGSDVNPLDSLVNANLGIDWIWNRSIQGSPVGYDTLMCIPEMDYHIWPGTIGAFNNVLVPLNSLYGHVDLLYGYCLEGIGSISDISVNSLNPERMKWKLYELGGPAPELRFTRYVVDFSGLLGRTPEDSIRYRQHYFRLNPFPYAGLTGNGLISCITNCSDTTSTWIQPGIENIQENFWESNLHQCGSGSSSTPENAMYPDGAYEVKITSYAHNGDIHEYLKQIVLDNYAPSINSVEVYQKTPYKPLYYAYWQTDPESEFRTLTSTTYGYLSDSLPCNLGVAISVTEPMNLDTLPELWFTGEWADGAGSWSSTSLAEEFQLVPCEWDAENLEPIPDNDWSYYCFETSSGITGYHGQLRLNISGGKDLSGNPIDGDPSTVSQLRTSPAGHTTGYDSGVDNNYLWDAACPTYGTTGLPPNTAGGTYWLGSSSGYFEVPLGPISGVSIVTRTPNGITSCCPWAHGFWVQMPVYGSVFKSVLNVFVIDLLGNALRRFSYPTRFEMCEDPGPPPMSISTAYPSDQILSGESFGNYCWIGVTSVKVGFADGAMVDDGADKELVAYKWLDVYCSSATGASGSYFLGSGEYYAFREFQHHNGDVDDIDVIIEVGPAVYDTVRLSPPQTDGIHLDVESLRDSSAEGIAVETGEFSLVLDHNPVTSSAVIRVNLTEPGYTELSIHDISGRVVQRAIQSEMSAGSHTVSLPLRLPSGVYFCRLTSGSDAVCEKLMVIR